MKQCRISLADVGADYSLSPEYWLSLDAAASLSEGVPFADLVTLTNSQGKPPESAKFVFDTSGARDGMVEIPLHDTRTKGRVSSKKRVSDGDVIISRLRPYLRQVAWIPHGATDMLGQPCFYVSTEFFVFRPHDAAIGAGLAAWLLSDPIQALVGEAATGGHHPRINSDLLLNAPVGPRYLESGYSETLGRLFFSHLKGQFLLRRHLSE